MSRARSKLNRDEFSLKQKNQISLGDDSNLDKDYKPIKIGGKGTIMNLSKTTLDVVGNLTVNGNSVQTGADAGATQLSELSDVTYSSGDLTIDSLDKIITGGDLDLEVGGDVIFCASGDVNVTGSDLTIDNGKELYFDGGDDTYIKQTTSDQLDIYVGGVNMLRLDEGTDDVANFLTSAVGFTQDEPTFNATDTIVLFSTKGNKAKVTLTNNCTDIHFKFPTVSGNFICVLLQDGTGGRTISNWKTQDSAGNAGAGNSGLVLWAGGTAPSNTETANKADIASFYWDADNEIAYGTYSYNF